MTDCVFCAIVRGEVPSHAVWEDERHLAFLSIFPNTEGVTVVIPKEHQDSYIFAASPSAMHGLVDATRTVAKRIERAFGDVGRCALVFEGFGVNHLHAKLFPMHGTAAAQWRPIDSDVDTYFERYPGYISTHDAKKAEEAALAATAAKIRGT